MRTRWLLLPLLAVLSGTPAAAVQEDARRAERVLLPAPDGVTVFAKRYLRNPQPEAPLLVLFHDSMQSMDEYKNIAPKFCRKGFNCLTVDLRAGNTARGPKSNTALNANTAALSILDAELDVVGALEWARSEHPGRPVVAVGCSYSAGLSLRVAGTRPELVDAVIAFSPAEVFGPHGASETWIEEAAPAISCPVLISSARSEEREWRAIFDALPAGLGHSFFAAGKGTHGARALKDGSPASEETWQAVLEFLHGPVAEHVAARGAAAPEGDSAEHLFDRVVVAGASLTNGIQLDTTLAGVLEATLRRAHAPIVEHSSIFFFTDPAEHLREALAVAREARPTLVVGLDLLFWFGYGDRRLDGELLALPSERLELLEHGLAQLATLDCPVVVADFPNMEAASGGLLSPTQLPDPETLVALNERLATYAAEHPNLVVFPLAAVYERIRSGAPLRIGRHRWPADSKDRLVLEDELHATLEGLCALVHAVAVELVERGLCAEEDLVLDLAEVLDAFDEVFVDGE